MSLRYRLWHRRYGIDRVHGEDGRRDPWWFVRTRYTIEPDDVGGRRWRWHVWLEFRYRPNHWPFPAEQNTWRPSPMEYSERRGGPHEICGTERTRDAAEQRAREAIDDVNRRIAAGETLRNAREAARYEDTVHS